jgi:rod shape-determining protein MreD
MRRESLWDDWLKRSVPRLMLNCAVTVGSALLCLLLSPGRIPGMQLAGVGPNWILIWVVAWSIRRSTLQAAIAGFVMGLVQDGMTSPTPTHCIGLVVAGVLTARLRKDRYIQEDFISAALIVFVMAIVVETVTAVQYSLQGNRPLGEIWTYHQFIALSSAILSSLWAPIVSFPLNQWWQRINFLDQKYQ